MVMIMMLAEMSRYVRPSASVHQDGDLAHHDAHRGDRRDLPAVADGRRDEYVRGLSARAFPEKAHKSAHCYAALPLCLRVDFTNDCWLARAYFRFVVRVFVALG